MRIRVAGRQCPNEDAYVHRQLGELAEGMRGLQQSLRRIEESGQRSEDKSAERRAVVHKRMDEIVSRVGHLETSSFISDMPVSR